MSHRVTHILMNMLITSEDNYLRLYWPVSSIARPIIHGHVVIYGSGAMEDLHVMHEVLVTSLNNRAKL